MKSLPLLAALACSPMVTLAAQGTDCVTGPFFEFQVEQPATVLRDSVVSPMLTRDPRPANLVQFIVDTAGRVEVESFKVLKMTDSALVTELRKLLPLLRYTPARNGSCVVRQLVQTAVVRPPGPRRAALALPSVVPRPVRLAPPAKGSVCVDCTRPRQIAQPTVIVKDSAYRVLGTYAASMTATSGLPVPQMEPSEIAGLELVKPDAAVAALGKGFEDGIAIITLTPAGTRAWHQRMRCPTPECRATPR